MVKLFLMEMPRQFIEERRGFFKTNVAESIGYPHRKRWI